MPDNELLARKLMGYSDIQSNMFETMPEWLKEYVDINIEHLGELIRLHLVDSMPLEQETGTLVVSFKLTVDKAVPTNEAVLLDIDSIIRAAKGGANNA